MIQGNVSLNTFLFSFLRCWVYDLSKYGSGDDGKSIYIASKERIWKDDVFFETIGEIDELNSFIGLARSIAQEKKLDEVNLILKKIQNHLLKIGGEINTIGSEYYEKVPKLSENDLQFLENQIDRLEKNLPELKNFILPSGSKLASILHVCRTVCRRAERRVVGFHKKRKIPELILRYFNRLSTLFFILARYVNYIEEYEEEIWKT